MPSSHQNEFVDPYEDIHNDHVLVPESCGCVSKWMPEMQDKLGTVYRCPDHQKEHDESMKNTTTFSSPESLAGLIHQTLRSAINRSEPLDSSTEQTRTDHFETGQAEGK